MTTTPWSDALSVGLETLDEDHRHILLVNDLLVSALGTDAEEAVLDSIATLLADYTLLHFRREERVMLACDYPQLPSHRALHENLRDKLGTIMARRGSEPVSVVGRELADFMNTWVADHLGRHDLLLKPVIAADRERATAAANEVLMLPDLLGRAPAHADGSSPEDFSRLRILIVDPSGCFHECMALALAGLGVYDVRHSGSVKAAQVDIDAGPVDVIFCRDQLPDARGLALLDWLNKRDGSQPCSLVMVTKSDDNEWKAAALDAGAAGFLYLPLSTQYLHAALTRLTPAP